jgi:predicted flap endonuclease-1-like 5' DNA nuclease
LTWFALQSLFLILGAFLVGLFTGWLTWGRQSQPERIVVLHEDGTPARHTAPLLTTPSPPVTGSMPVVTEPEPAIAPATGALPVPDPGPPTPEDTTPEPERAEPGSADDPDDDLRRIEGIGPKVAEALQAEGIRRYADLAECDDQRLRDLLRTAGLRFSPTLQSWPAQAKLLAAGDDEGFERLSAQVAAERRTAGTS